MFLLVLENNLVVFKTNSCSFNLLFQLVKDFQILISEQTKCLGKQYVVLDNRNYTQINIKEPNVTKVQRVDVQIIKTGRM